jgi:hypothetical protein
LTVGLSRLRKKSPDKRKISNAEHLVAKWKIKVAEKKNELAEKKDILLPDKPKPPKKGQIFKRLRKAKNG